MVWALRIGKNSHRSGFRDEFPNKFEVFAKDLRAHAIG
jgi:hypothetical protein